MKRSQFEGIIAHIERAAIADGYEIEIATAADTYQGALLPKITGREDVIGLRIDVFPNVYIDINAIISVRGPLL